jgi:hypothetical protein
MEHPSGLGRGRSVSFEEPIAPEHQQSVQSRRITRGVGSWRIGTAKPNENTLCIPDCSVSSLAMDNIGE